MPPLTEEDALELLVERARAVRPAFEPDEAALGICRRLDCMPLAIELAAARLKHLTALDLLARLGRSLDLLTGGARDLPERQRTLRATIEWSYRLLSAERQVFDRLAVFSGRAPLEQAEIVCAVEGERPLHVSTASRRSPITTFSAGSPIREKCITTSCSRPCTSSPSSGWRSGARRLSRRRHRDAYLALVEQVKPIHAVAGIAALVPERNNLRAALQWSLAEDAGSDKTCGRPPYMVWRYWFETGATAEGRAWLEAASRRRKRPMPSSTPRHWTPVPCSRQRWASSRAPCS